MEEWKTYKIGDICYTNKAQYSSRDKMPHVIYLDTGNITENVINELQYIQIGVDKLPSRARRKVKSCDIIFSNVRPIQKHYGFLKNPPKEMLVSTGFSVLSAKQDLCHPLYLYYFITKKEIVECLQTIGEQAVSTYPTIKTSDIENLNITLPDIVTQQKIANILSSLDDKIEVNRRINEQLEELAQALFKSWFVDFEPFKDGNFVESELGMIPEGWKVGSIYEYINVIYGAPYKSSLFNNKGNGLPLIRIRDLKTNQPQFYTPEILPNTEYISRGDVVAGMDAEFSPYIWLGEKGVLNQRCCKFVGKYDEISNYYIIFLLKPELEFVQSYKTGTTVSHLGKSDIDKFKVILPPLEIICNFSKKVNPLLNRKIQLAEEITHLSNLRDTLLPKLMSGEIDVNEVKI